MKQLALLTDAQARECLLGTLKKGALAKGRLYSDLVKSETALLDVLAQAAQGDPDLKNRKMTAKESPETIRIILVEIAAQPGLRGSISAWLNQPQSGRVTTRFADPITATLVLAGIVFALSLDVEVKVDAKGRVSGHLKKAPTDSNLLKKFFELFA
jgi:hypothetical protein